MLPRVVTTGVVTHGEPILYVEPKDVPITLRFLRDHTGTRCKQLVDITAVDVPTREKRFEVGRRRPKCMLLALLIQPLARTRCTRHNATRNLSRVKGPKTFGCFSGCLPAPKPRS